ncbi:MAG TPA: hypothetical protein H9790_08840 [Candidatus Agathobaculum intestinipullorum]|nr:hypothetical protein [Candidatus Agathobaculum intestinipullorum]
MKRLAAVLAVLMLAVGAALWWLPRVLAPQVGSPYEAAALLEQDVRAGGDGLLFCAEQVDPDEVYRALEACYPYAFSLHATVRPNRTVELQVQASRQARQAQAQSYAAALAADSIQEGMSDVQKLRALHDTLVRLCQYDTDTAEQVSPDGATAPFAADGALLDHRAVCSGYGRAFGMLCEAAGIDSIYIASEEMNHGWNAVRLDGQTYFIDCTFDDPVPDRGAYVSDQYFMLTAEELAATHVWDQAFYEQLLDSMENAK